MANNSTAFPDWKSLKRLIWINDLCLKFSITEPSYSLMVCLLFCFPHLCAVLQGLISSLPCSIINICHHLRKKNPVPAVLSPGAIKEWEMALSNQYPTGKRSRLTGFTICRRGFPSVTLLSMVYAFPFWMVTRDAETEMKVYWENPQLLYPLKFHDSLTNRPYTKRNGD